MKKHIIQNLALDEQLALQIRTITQHAIPLAPLTEPQDTLNAFKLMTHGYERSIFLAQQDQEVIGFIMLMKGPKSSLARVMGAVSPQYQGVGIGYELWQTVLSSLKYYPKISQLQGRTFASLTSGKAFLERANFTLVERMIWLEFDLNHELPQRIQEKLQRTDLDSIQVMSLQDFSKLRTDWEQVCWQLEIEASQAIPTQLGILQPSLEEWRSAQATFQSEKTLLAVQDKEPLGVIKLSEPRNDYVNINFTGVAASHRRKGVSSLLKSEAINYAKKHKISRITTQNHSINQAILKANLGCGFKETNQLLDYLYEL